ncbi:MAG: biotin/lipoyl-containing protein [Bryobacteraceae bacterium]
MRFGDREVRLEWRREGDVCRFRFGEDEERIANVVEVEPDVYSVLIEGRSHEARSEDGAVVVDGHRIEVERVDARRWARNARARGGLGREQVKAPMPGKVVRVLVEPGDAVEAGQGLVVVEAMKMQNQMKAAHGGRVVAVAVAPGATVNPGDVLVTIE